MGRCLARLDTALGTLTAPLPPRNTNWDITEIAGLTTQLREPGRPTRRQQLWASVLEEFALAALPRVARLPNQLIHNDLNPSNYLVDPDGNRVSGIFDFGDVIRAPRVVDLAVAAAYLLDPSDATAMVAGLASVVAGYHDQSPLGEEEITLVPHIVLARYAQALILNTARAESATEDPRYVAYVLRNSARSDACLSAVRAVTVDVLAERLGRSATVSGGRSGSADEHACPFGSDGQCLRSR